jgi:ribosomal protein L14E/L6E/L27E
MKTKYKLSILSLIILIWGIWLYQNLYPTRHTETSSKNSLTTKIADDTVAATVNGTPITVKEIKKVIPKGTLPYAIGAIAKSRLLLLTSLEVQAQFLSKNKISVSEQEINDELAHYKKLPNPEPCKCGECPELTYATIILIKEAKKEDIRKFIKCDLGINKYIHSSWEKISTEYAKLEKTKAKAKHRAAHDFKLYHIFLPVKANISGEALTKELALKKEQATKISIRLQKGEDFAKLAKELSEDELTKEKGGYCGLIAKHAMTKKLVTALDKLNNGKATKPIQIKKGWVIAKKEAISVDDIMPEEEAKYVTKEKLKLLERIYAESKIVTLPLQYYNLLN